MDIAKTDLEKIILIIKIINNLINIFNLLKEIINVLVELKNINLYHTDIKPVNILMSKKYIKDLDEVF